MVLLQLCCVSPEDGRWSEEPPICWEAIHFIAAGSAATCFQDGRVRGNIDLQLLVMAIDVNVMKWNINVSMHEMKSIHDFNRCQWFPYSQWDTCKCKIIVYIYIYIYIYIELCVCCWSRGNSIHWAICGPWISTIPPGFLGDWAKVFCCANLRA